MPTSMCLSLTMEVRMAAITVLIIRRKWHDRSLVSQNRTKEEVLHNWQLPQHFCVIHSYHPLVNFVPGLYL